MITIFQHLNCGFDNSYEDLKDLIVKITLPPLWDDYISEVFAKEKMNVIGVQTQSVKGTAWMTFTVEISDAVTLNKVLGSVRGVKGVRAARRR